MVPRAWSVWLPSRYTSRLPVCGAPPPNGCADYWERAAAPATRGALGLSTAQKGALLQAGLQPFKNSALTVAGRALTKHPDLVGLTKATLNQRLRSPAAINAAAEGALGGILRTGTATVRELGRFGMTLEIRAARGFGARFSQATGEFIGFITP